jgi:hypothetical protein
LCRAETAPLGECGGTVFLEDAPAGEASLGIEVVGDGGVDGSELLPTSHPSDAEHGPTSPLEFQFAIVFGLTILELP